MSFLTVFQQKEITISDALFNESNIKGISINMHEGGVFTDKKYFYWNGRLKFEQGSLKGEKEFRVDGKDGMIQLVKEMEEFIKTLK